MYGSTPSHGTKNPSANARNVRDAGSMPGSGRYLGEGNDNPLQYSCLANSMERRAWWVTVHGVTKSHQLSTHIGMVELTALNSLHILFYPDMIQLPQSICYLLHDSKI